MQEYADRDEDPIRAFVQVNPAPEDAQRMGLDRNTVEGALVAMAGSLQPARLSHRLTAWALLLVFVAPWVFGLLRDIFT